MNKNDFSNIDFSNIKPLQINPMESLNRQIRQQEESMRIAGEDIHRAKKEQVNREIENNESLKQIVQYNKTLTDLNEKMLLKISLVNGSLDDILNSIGANSQSLEVVNTEQNKKLQELMEILKADTPDKNNKVMAYFAGLSGNVAVEIFASYLKIKYFGLT